MCIVNYVVKVDIYIYNLFECIHPLYCTSSYVYRHYNLLFCDLWFKCTPCFEYLVKHKYVTFWYVITLTFSISIELYLLRVVQLTCFANVLLSDYDKYIKRMQVLISHIIKPRVWVHHYKSFFVSLLLVLNSVTNGDRPSLLLLILVPPHVSSVVSISLIL